MQAPLIDSQACERASRVLSDKIKLEQVYATNAWREQGRRRRRTRFSPASEPGGAAAITITRLETADCGRKYRNLPPPPPRPPRVCSPNCQRYEDMREGAGTGPVVADILPGEEIQEGAAGHPLYPEEQLQGAPSALKPTFREVTRRVLTPSFPLHLMPDQSDASFKYATSPSGQAGF